MSGVPVRAGNSPEKTIEVVGVGWRLIATLIDGLLLGFLTFLLGFCIGLLISLSGIYGAGRFYPSERLIMLSGLILAIAYYVGFWVKSGQTPGKMALGIKVVSTDGLPLSSGQAFLRYVGYIVNLIVMSIGFLWIAFDRKRQGWHDKIAGTYVIFAGSRFSDNDTVRFVPSDPDRKWLWLIVWIVVAVVLPLGLLGSLWVLGPAITEVFANVAGSLGVID